LIWIKRRAAVFGDVVPSGPHPQARKLTSRSRPTIRQCPVCGIAMQASKSLENLAEFDTFECLSCHTVIRESKPRPPDGGKKTASGTYRTRPEDQR
jgi:hypothetical protein